MEGSPLTDYKKVSKFLGFLGFLFFWFSISWFLGFKVSWLIGFKIYCFRSFLVSSPQSFEVPRFQRFKNHFMFVDRYRSHITKILFPVFRKIFIPYARSQENLKAGSSCFIGVRLFQRSDFGFSCIIWSVLGSPKIT